MTGKRILVVEDQAVTALDEDETLRKLGYEVAGIVFTGEDAVRRAALDKRDAILMDIKLAGAMDGIEAAREIRKNQDVPVISITAFGDKGNSDPEKIQIPEGYGYIVKPFNHDELAEALEKVLD